MDYALRYRDRQEAGTRLGGALLRRPFDRRNSILLGLPRGGVPVAAAAAKVLGVPFDVLVVRKAGVPWQPELAMGAVAPGVRLLNRQLIEELEINPADVERIVQREQQEVERREGIYRAGRPPLALGGRTVILIDDGLATGATMQAAIECVRHQHPHAVAVAVPVASVQAGALMRKTADDYLALAEPEPFQAVGEWYEDFRQTSDAEVVALLQS